MSFDETIRLKSGLEMPAFGYGTWKMGEIAAHEAEEIATIRQAIERGVRHFDTAEMYGDGSTELLLGKALAGVDRSNLFITSKFYPFNASKQAMVNSCENSLDRLETDYLDLYLLHWPGQTAFEETLEGAHHLLEQGKIRGFGISNFDFHDLGELINAGLDGLIDVNQVMYNAARRGIEFDLLPLMQLQNIACVAYTPIEPQLLGRNGAFTDLAQSLGFSPAELALSWHMTSGRAVPIPKCSKRQNLDGLLRAAQTTLDADVMTAIDSILPPPDHAVSLDIL
ncbi:MAG: aldo/keto reductase [Hyphomicrobiales bacterium]